MDKRELTSILAKPQKPNQTIQAQFKEFNKNSMLDLKQATSYLNHYDDSRVDILSDQPVSKDELDVEPLALTLSNIILSKHTETPITIAIHGKWGTGKSSILRMIENQARWINYPCLWLNAWSLESTENLIASVASEIQKEFASNSNFQKKKSKDTFYNILLNWVQKAASASGSLLTSVDPTGLSQVLDKAIQNLEKSEGLVQASREREHDISEITELASIVTTRRSFESLIQILLEDNEKRLIVFIDDIDRALPDQIANILKNLKLILEIPQCVFILAMDIDIVAQSITNFYQSRQNFSTINFADIMDSDVRIITDENELIEGSFGYNYLEKLIQLRADVPKLTRKMVERYLRLKGIASEIQEIIYFAPDEDILNPRRLKRYINWLSLSLQLIISLPISTDLSNEFMLRTMAFKRDYPEIFRLLLASSNNSLLIQDFKDDLLEKRGPENDYFVIKFKDYLKTWNSKNINEFESLTKKFPLLNRGAMSSSH